MSRLGGRLSDWNDERGFGFITPISGPRIFVHISEFGGTTIRPQVGDILSYRLGRSPDGRPRAVDVHGVGGDTRRRPRRRASTLSHLLPIVLFAIVYLVADHVWAVPLWAAGIYLAVSALTLVTYAVDKSSAQRGGWRISEGMLNLLAFLGGWPGAIIAQQILRHKTIKSSFRARFWMAVVANILLFVVLASPLLRLAAGSL